MHRYARHSRLGGIALDAVAIDIDKRLQAVAVSTMYDTAGVMSKGYNDGVALKQRTKALEHLSQQRWDDAVSGNPPTARHRTR